MTPDNESATTVRVMEGVILLVCDCGQVVVADLDQRAECGQNPSLNINDRCPIERLEVTAWKAVP